MTPKVDWHGRTVVIVAGGESVSAKAIRQIAIARLEDRIRVISVSDAIYLLWNSDWLHSYDHHWWASNATRIQSFSGIKTSVCGRIPAAWGVKVLQRTGKTGFDPNFWACRGSTSGMQALHCAIHTSPERIFLVGFDMNQGHWFGGSERDLRPLASDFETLLPALKDRSIKVYNCSAFSNISCFDRSGLLI